MNKQFQILILNLLIITANQINAKTWKYNLSKCPANGLVDVSKCLQKAINISQIKKERLFIPKGLYLISQPIILQSNTYIKAESAIIIPHLLDPIKSVFISNETYNITISGIIIRDNGYYSSHLSTMKTGNINESIKYIGFSNLDVGINLAKSNNVVIKNCSFIGIHNGIKIEEAKHILIENNNFINLGVGAIKIIKSSFIQIKSNQINEVNGNTVIGIHAQIKNSKFADGIYLENIESALISNNNIQNIHRIAIVVEGANANSNTQPKFINTDIIITNNQIINVNNCTGTEYNAGIWIEPYNNKNNIYYKTLNVLISNNFINNKNALSCQHPQYGIRLGAYYNIVMNNHISNFINHDSAAICYSFGNNIIKNNKFIANTTNIFHAHDNEKFSKLIQN